MNVKSWSFGIVIVLAVLVAGHSFFYKCCRSQPTSSDSAGNKRQIAVIPKGTTHDFWKAVHAGALKAAQETGVNIFWNGPNREGDRDSQISILEDFMIKKVNAVVLAPLDDTALVPTVENIGKAGIPCVIFDSGITTDRYVSFVATDNYKGGALAAKRMAQILNGKGSVLVIKYMTGSSSTTEREKGFIETLQQAFPAIRIADTKFGMDTVETALQAAEDLLTRNPKVDGIFACNESTSVGTLRALESQGRVGKIKMVGFDASAPLVNALRAGKIDSLVVQNPFRMGYLGVKSAVAALDGQNVPKRIDTGVTLIKKDNIDSLEIQKLLNPR